ncbi:54S ribosomal protein, mitochondrial [Serendipita sp. 397]|nr:54S ribosomal protein, mitochondrial [Serendipita sp. 397]KAG8801187.1 54S ribosomal protein, mitochondrial [Serendipita sp. 398]KAG8823371.1 54S ribosomal protein, mitochondrial [Serendipita sp. 400]
MLAKRVGSRITCLSHVGRAALFRTASTVAPGLKPSLEPQITSNVKVHGEVDPKLVKPVLQWLLDDAAPMPFIPVEAKFESKAPSWLPIKAFCGAFTKDKLVHLDPSIFNHPIRQDILHACITWYRDGLRRGTASTKTRYEVNGSGRKLRPQKGSGRARLGDRGSPMLRGGGRAFGPKPRDFSTELPRKVRQMGLKVALSSKLRARRLTVVPSVTWPNAKTKWIAGRLKGLGREFQKGCLLVTGSDSLPPKLVRATSNLSWVTCKTAKEVQVWDLLARPYVIMSLDAIQWFQKNLSSANHELSKDRQLPTNAAKATVSAQTS